MADTGSSRGVRLTRLRGGWAVSYWRDGTRRRYSLGTDDLAEAKKILETWQEPAAPTRRRASSIVYFIRSECPNQFIKIGIANDLNTRLSGLQVSAAYPLTVMATMPGGPSVESELHARFAEAHERGEWFRPAPELLAYIAAIKPPAPQEPTINVDGLMGDAAFFDSWFKSDPEGYARHFVDTVSRDMLPEDQRSHYDFVKRRLAER